jgi:hypothetical protein
MPCGTGIVGSGAEAIVAFIQRFPANQS